MSDELFDILPFRFLDRDGRALLARRVTEQAWPAGSLLIQRGDLEDRRVFLLLDGEVEALDATGRRVGRVDAGHYFGERAALFDQPRMFDMRAVGPVRAATLPGPDLLTLLRKQPAFANALGLLLREKQGIFLPFDRFLSEVQHGAATGHLIIPRLLHLYRPLRPALHRLSDSDAIDLDALKYALSRLPKNIGSTLSLLLTEDVPWLFSKTGATFHEIETAARRRTVYELMPGKSMVVLRDGWSDLVDLVTCLCIYAVEIRKLRHRIADPERLQDLVCDAPGAVERVFDSPELLDDVRRIWPDLRPRLIQLATHHEDFAISVLKSVDNYNSAHSERWTRQIAEATRALTGLDPRELPEDHEIHIVSSNTHSVGNCLSRWLQDEAEAILAWGATARPQIVGLPWKHRTNLLVALARDYLVEFPERVAARDAADRAKGVRILDETALTGIGVQLFDLDALRGRTMDPELPQIAEGRRGTIVNIDYAFGQQAEPIVASLIALFGPRIRSINILGKAGGLEGRRGDLMVATSFVEQQDDMFHVPATTVDMARLKARVPDRIVLRGPILTVIGTVIQNQVMLNFYRRIWGCVGLEMEGSYYCRQILESQHRGALRQDVALRFLYYISDLPLHAGETLSGGMQLMEGIPPLYGITREVLASIFEGPSPAGDQGPQSTSSTS